MWIINTVTLEACKISDIRYQEIRDRHYVANNGTHGQQLHFLIHYMGGVVGIISGASSVYAVKSRDVFFNIPDDKHLKEKRYLPSIINNTVFRLEYHEKNLGTKVLSKFRKVSAELWEYLYQVKVIGFETFVVEEDYRKGAVYKADNWTFVGNTKGSTKKHNGLSNKSVRLETCEKLVFCRWVGKPIIPTVEYVSSWRGSTILEKERGKELSCKRKEIINHMY